MDIIGIIIKGDIKEIIKELMNEIMKEEGIMNKENIQGIELNKE